MNIPEKETWENELPSYLAVSYTHLLSFSANSAGKIHRRNFGSSPAAFHSLISSAFLYK